MPPGCPNRAPGGTYPEAPAGVIAAALLHDVVEDTGRSDVDLVAADIADNTDPDRVAQLDQPTRKRLELKYSRARALLAGDTGL